MKIIVFPMSYFHACMLLLTATRVNPGPELHWIQYCTDTKIKSWLNPKEIAALTEKRQQMDIDRNNQEVVVNKAGVSLSKPNPWLLWASYRHHNKEEFWSSIPSTTRNSAHPSSSSLCSICRLHAGWQLHLAHPLYFGFNMETLQAKYWHVQSRSPAPSIVGLKLVRHTDKTIYEQNGSLITILINNYSNRARVGNTHKSKVKINTQNPCRTIEASVNIWATVPSDGFYSVHTPPALNLSHAEKRKSGWHKIILWNWDTHQ